MTKRTRSATRATAKNPMPHPYRGRQSKRALTFWVHAMQLMIAELIQTWPQKQQIAALDSLLQMIVQRLNYLRDREKMYGK